MSELSYFLMGLGLGCFLMALAFLFVLRRHDREQVRIRAANRRMDLINGDNQNRCPECGATLGGHTGLCSRSAMVRGDMSGYDAAPRCPECGWSDGTHTSTCRRAAMARITGY